MKLAARFLVGKLAFGTPLVPEVVKAVETAASQTGVSQAPTVSPAPSKGGRRKLTASQAPSVSPAPSKAEY
jgi:hypothetical protein